MIAPAAVNPAGPTGGWRRMRIENITAILGMVLGAAVEPTWVWTPLDHCHRTDQRARVLEQDVEYTAANRRRTRRTIINVLK